MTEVTQDPSQLPEAQIPVIDNLQAAVAHARKNIGDFSYTAGRIGIKDGTITASSLESGLAALVAETEGEDGSPHLAEFATLMAQLSAERGFDVFNPSKDPMVSFLVSRGAYEKSKPVSMGESPTLGADQRIPKLGRQIIADGNVVRGEIVPGVGVRTSKGIVRTHSSPRLA
jgi:hypothetical protein